MGSRRDGAQRGTNDQERCAPLKDAPDIRNEEPASDLRAGDRTHIGRGELAANTFRVCAGLLGNPPHAKVCGEIARKGGLPGRFRSGDNNAPDRVPHD